MEYSVTLIPGDGIGPEIVREAVKVLDKVAEVYGHSFRYKEILMGGCSIDAYGVPLTDEALETAKSAMRFFWELWEETWEIPAGMILPPICARKRDC